MLPVTSVLCTRDTVKPFNLAAIKVGEFTSKFKFICTRDTVKPFNLAAIKVGEFTSKFILGASILTNPNYTVPTLK